MAFHLEKYGSNMVKQVKLRQTTRLVKTCAALPLFVSVLDFSAQPVNMLDTVQQIKNMLHLGCNSACGSYPGTPYLRFRKQLFSDWKLSKSPDFMGQKISKHVMEIGSYCLRLCMVLPFPCRTHTLEGDHRPRHGFDETTESSCSTAEVSTGAGP